MPDSFHWLDVQRIAEELADRFPERRPYDVNFVDLRRMVESLPGFAAQANHPPNEKILETIQQLWNDEREDITRDDD
ncbi:MAG: Fe-S cluster assembly protein IscX [Phycisphaerales bacterium]|jgi:FeS assembly protein IscX|nr:Fe-S cluster assembly protein IscX [Phycisphaerales bacterium]